MKTSSTTHGESKTTTSTPLIMKSERLVTRPGSMLTSVRDERRNNRATCKITTETDTGLISYGIGSLILARGGIPCILTNHHVLPNKEVAKISRAKFFDDDDNEILNIEFDVDELFVTHPVSCLGTENCYEGHMKDDKGLDFTLVALVYSKHLPSSLLMSSDSVPKGASLSTFGYPSGGPKCRSQGDAIGLSVCNRYVHYELSTQSGSSGSPVFMDGRFVALHRATEQDPRDSSKFVNVGSLTKEIWKVLDFKPEDVHGHAGATTAIKQRANADVFDFYCAVYDIFDDMTYY